MKVVFEGDCQSFVQSNAAIALTESLKALLGARYKVFVIAIEEGSVVITFDMASRDIVRLVAAFALGSLSALPIVSIEIPCSLLARAASSRCRALSDLLLSFIREVAGMWPTYAIYFMLAVFTWRFWGPRERMIYFVIASLGLLFGLCMRFNRILTKKRWCREIANAEVARLRRSSPERLEETGVNTVILMLGRDSHKSMESRITS